MENNKLINKVTLKAAAIIVVALTFIIVAYKHDEKTRAIEEARRLSEEASRNISQVEETKTEEDTSGQLTEDGVYSFLQGPKSYERQVTWSGEWCNEILLGHRFGSFGCGMCCMANIYDTLSPYQVNPVETYYCARENTGYMPSQESAAIGWGDLKNALKKMGMNCDVYYKPATYEEFKSQMGGAQTMIALVCSYNDDSYWTNTGGHYVNLWLYNEETEEVFLAEPGSPDKNRSWIPLSYVYDALKTSSEFQYLLVDSYDEEQNEWKADGIGDYNWVSPEK